MSGGFNFVTPDQDKFTVQWYEKRLFKAELSLGKSAEIFGLAPASLVPTFAAERATDLLTMAVKFWPADAIELLKHSVPVVEMQPGPSYELFRINGMAPADW